jgi:creatinine amidohydrolase/Fe(II)-dependent formamide hydrolase-like protein
LTIERWQRTLVTAGALLFPAAAGAQVLDLRELNTEQIRALDRARTVVVMQGGILEEHGPYMPSYIDGYAAERQARDLAEAIAARPGWTALLYPPIPLGQGGANIIGGRYSFPGSYNVRSETLRAVYMDLADAFGAQGFRWVFVVDGHGSPNHNHALNMAADYFRDTHGGMMVHLYGLMALRGCCPDVSGPLLGPEGVRENGFTVHASAVEHSVALYLRPDLVSPRIAQAPAITGRDFADLVRFARQDGWPGYFGAPARASAALGAQVHRAETANLVATALRILDGWDPRREPRYEDVVQKDPATKAVDDAADQEDARNEARQRAWLAGKDRR